MSFDYTGFKLGEKKNIKEKEPVHAAAEKKIQDKLGADWKLFVDWQSIEKASAAGNEDAQRYRNHMGEYIYVRYCTQIADEISKWDADTAEAVNDAVKDKKVVIGFNPEKVNERYRINVGSTIEVLIQAEKVAGEYPIDSALTVTKVVEKSL